MTSEDDQKVSSDACIPSCSRGRAPVRGPRNRPSARANRGPWRGRRRGVRRNARAGCRPRPEARAGRARQACAPIARDSRALAASAARRARRAVARDALLEQAPRGGREAVGHRLAHQPGAEAEAPVVEREQAPLAEPVELLGDLGRVQLEHAREPRGRERLLEQAGRAEQPAGGLALGAAAIRDPLGARPPAALVRGDREADEQRVPLGAVVEVGDRRAARGRAPRAPRAGCAASAAAERRGGRCRPPPA